MKKLLIVFFALCSYQVIAQNNIKIEVKFNRINSLMRFIDIITASHSEVYNIGKLFQQSKYNDPKSRQYIEDYKSLRLNHSFEYEGYPENRHNGGNTKNLLLIASSNATDMNDLRIRCLGLFPQKDQKKLFEILQYFTPIYDSLIWKPYEKDLLNQQQLLSNFIQKQNIETRFRQIATFYHSEWQSDLPFYIYLNPVPGKHSTTNAAPLGNIIMADICLETQDHAVLLSIVLHEMCHLLYSEQSTEMQTNFENFFLSNKSDFKIHSYNWINEAFASAIGNGWIYKQFTGKLDTAEWYNNFYINSYSKKIYPIVSNYLESNKSIDNYLVENCISIFSQTFPDATIEYNNLLTFFSLVTDTTPGLIYNKLFQYFEPRSMNASTPIELSTIKEMKESFNTQFMIVTKDHDKNYKLLAKEINGIQKTETSKDFIQSWTDDNGMAYIYINCVKPENLEKAFKVLSEKKKIDPKNKLIFY
ncbi:MAG: hypothetical protein HY958_01755 [Bacteroidia bacterium]|nr:hypothetical protein [Bacteroidia bacterium]